MSQVSAFARRLRRLEDRLRPRQRRRLIVLDVEVEPSLDEHGNLQPCETGEQFIYDRDEQGIERRLHRDKDGTCRELVGREWIEVEYERT